MVGKTEAQLTDAGIPYEAGIAQYKELARGQLLGDTTDHGQVYGIATVTQFGARGRHHSSDEARAACHSYRDVTDEAVEKGDPLIFEVSPLREDLLGPHINGLAEGSRRDAFRAAVEQFGTELRFELVDALAQARLRDAQDLGRLAEASPFERRYEPLQLT